MRVVLFFVCLFEKVGHRIKSVYLRTGFFSNSSAGILGCPALYRPPVEATKTSPGIARFPIGGKIACD